MWLIVLFLCIEIWKEINCLVVSFNLNGCILNGNNFFG